MADFAHRRAGHPLRSVVTVAELLGRAQPPPDETVLSVSALIRREGYPCDLAVRAVQPRADRTVSELGIPRRRIAISVGAVLTVGSLAGAAIMLGNAAPRATNSDALDGGYPGRGVADQPGPPGPNGADGLPSSLAPVSFPGPLGPARPPSTALNSGVVPSGPVGTGNASSGGVIGGSARGVARSGGGLVGNTVDTVGAVTGLLGGAAKSSSQDPISTLTGKRSVSSGTRRTQPETGSALSALTKPITAGDARRSSSGSKRSTPSRSLTKVLSGLADGSHGSGDSKKRGSGGALSKALSGASHSSSSSGSKKSGSGGGHSGGLLG